MKKALFLIIFHALVASSVIGQGKLYGYNMQQFYTLDLSTGEIGISPEFPTLGGIGGSAFDINNGLYMMIGVDDVIIVNMASDTIINQFPFDVGAIAYNPNNNRILGYTGSTLFALDPDNGNITTIGEFPEIGSFLSEAFDPTNGIFFLQNQEKLFGIDASDGTLVYELDFQATAIEFDINSGEILGFSPPNLQSINLSTGTISDIGTYPEIPSFSGHTYDIDNNRLVILAQQVVYFIDPSNGALVEQYDFPVVDIEYGNPELTSIFDFEYLAASSIQLFPNPTSDKIFLQTDAIQNLDVSIYNAQGVLLKELDNTREVDLSELCAGIYYFFIKNRTQTFIKKVIKVE